MTRRGDDEEERMTGNSGNTGADSGRAQREKDFHDTRFASDGRPAGRFYAITGATFECYRSLLAPVPTGARVLELGCGLQSEMWGLLERGVEVTAVDISTVAIEESEEHYRQLGLSGGAFLEMNAEHLDFGDDEFDAVAGSGILHHLDVERGVAEAARVLKPGGRLILAEPMGHNPVVNFYRRFTPDQRTPDEHPLVMDDFATMARYFDTVNLHFFHFLSIGALALSKTKAFDRAIDVLERADDKVFARVPWSRRMAWMVVVEAIGPR
jgi:SAM-dependent methyltransferase